MDDQLTLLCGRFSTPTASGGASFRFPPPAGRQHGTIPAYFATTDMLADSSATLQGQGRASARCDGTHPCRFLDNGADAR